MSGYVPTKITGMSSGLIQEREKFMLPDDAYPTLENAWIFREKIQRKRGYSLLGRLRRAFTSTRYFNSSASVWSFNLLSVSGYVSNTDIANPGNVTTTYPHNLSTGDLVWISGIVGATGYNNTQFTITVVDATNFTVGVNAAAFGAYVSGGFWWSNRSLAASEPNASLQAGATSFTVGAVTFTDNGLGVLTSATGGNSGTINYTTGAIALTHTAGAGASVTLTTAYYPGLPVMGVPTRELAGVNVEQMVIFDTRYAYVYSSPSFSEFIPGSSWAGSNSDFFWGTNFWYNETTNSKLFWVTNFSISTGDPIRYTDGTTWTNFTPAINATESVFGALMLIPFRSRMLALNTYEGTALGTSLQRRQRIRWAAIGNPLATDAWSDIIIGKGGFLDIPTAENIVSCGFVRDNLVIYCENSTWQLRYTGRSIAPFQIEKVNTELGAESTFSAVNFDTSLLGIGDKGVVECDSFSSRRIDMKIPDLVVFQFNNDFNGIKRVHGARDQSKKVVYWTYPDSTDNPVYPNRRLVYNYENESWAIFKDSITAMGTYQPVSDKTWNDIPGPWYEQNYGWITKQSLIPFVVGGNQHGFVEILDYQTINDPSLSISAIVGAGSTVPTRLTVYSHNLQTGDIIKISGIPSGTGYATDLNTKVYMVQRIGADTLDLFIYNSESDAFDLPGSSTLATYIGGGVISVRDNFRVLSKKFNAMDLGQKTQLGYVDVLTDVTQTTENDSPYINMNVYLDYRDEAKINNGSDTFFNVKIPMYSTQFNVTGQSMEWHRVYCNVRGNFYQIEYTLSNEQMTGLSQESDVQIHAQVVWSRAAGRMGV